MNKRVEKIIVKVAISPFFTMLLKCVYCRCIKMRPQMGKGELIYPGKTGADLLFSSTNEPRHTKMTKITFGFCATSR